MPTNCVYRRHCAFIPCRESFTASCAVITPPLLASPAALSRRIDHHPWVKIRLVRMSSRSRRILSSRRTGRGGAVSVFGEGRVTRIPTVHGNRTRNLSRCTDALADFTLANNVDADDIDLVTAFFHHHPHLAAPRFRVDAILSASSDNPFSALDEDVASGRGGAATCDLFSLLTRKTCILSIAAIILNTLTWTQLNPCSELQHAIYLWCRAPTKGRYHCRPLPLYPMVLGPWCAPPLCQRGSEWT